MLQPWRDLARLLRKQAILPESASPLFSAAPIGVLALTSVSALLVPSFATGMLTSPLADLLVIAGLLTAARVLLALAALDSGTALAGTGASRMTLLGLLAEPMLFLVILVIAGSAGTTNLDLAAAALRDAPLGLHAPLMLALPALAIAGFALNAPGGSAEPAMIEDAALLDYAGRDLAALQLARSLRLLLWLDLLATLACPFGLAAIDGGLVAWIAGIVLWMAKLLVLVAILVGAEALAGAFPPARRSAALGVALLLALVAAVFLFLGTGTV